MKWVEFIHLRGSPAGRDLVLKDLQRLMAAYRDVPGLVSVELLVHATYLGDLGVQLAWQNNRQPVKTREGVALADFMSRYGSVEHGVWVSLAFDDSNAET
jgi:hypothetical protein